MAGEQTPVMAGGRAACFSGGALIPREFNRDDLNRIVRKAAWRAQRNHQIIWAGLYDEMTKRSGKDIRALAELGISGAVVGKSLYEGGINIKAALAAAGSGA